MNQTHTNHCLKIQLKNLSPEAVLIDIRNLLGNNIFKEEFAKGSIFEINMKDITRGIYFVKVNTRDKMYIRKIIVE